MLPGYSCARGNAGKVRARRYRELRWPASSPGPTGRSVTGIEEFNSGGSVSTSASQPERGAGGESEVFQVPLRFGVSHSHLLIRGKLLEMVEPIKLYPSFF